MAIDAARRAPGHPDLTVAIAAYNGARFIGDTIENALRLDPLLVLVADDASTDDTRGVVARYAAMHPGRIRLVSDGKNVGLSANWNRAIALVTTPYCLKLDHDDLVVPGYVCAAMEFLRAHAEVGIVAGEGIGLVEGQTMAEMYEAACATGRAASARVTMMRDERACEFVLRWHPFACSSSTIYRVARWREIGGFDETLVYCNDREVWFRMARVSAIAFVHTTGAIWRAHRDNYTNFVRHEDRICIEYDRMFRRALADWDCPALRPLFMRNFAITAKAYLGSAVRRARIAPHEARTRLTSGLKALWLALRLFAHRSGRQTGR